MCELFSQYIFEMSWLSLHVKLSLALHWHPHLSIETSQTPGVSTKELHISIRDHPFIFRPPVYPKLAKVVSTPNADCCVFHMFLPCLTNPPTTERKAVLRFTPCFTVWPILPNPSSFSSDNCSNSLSPLFVVFRCCGIKWWLDSWWPIKLLQIVRFNSPAPARISCQKNGHMHHEHIRAPKELPNWQQSKWALTLLKSQGVSNNEMILWFLGLQKQCMYPPRCQIWPKQWERAHLGLGCVEVIGKRCGWVMMGRPIIIKVSWEKRYHHLLSSVYCLVGCQESGVWWRWLLIDDGLAALQQKEREMHCPFQQCWHNYHSHNHWQWWWGIKDLGWGWTKP